MKKNKHVIAIFLLLAAIVIFMSARWYYTQLNDRTYKTTIANIQELAQHDQTSIVSSINKNWAELESIHYRISQYDYTDLRQVQERLHIEQDSNILENIYYVSEDGKLYSGNYSISEAPDMTAPLLNGSRQFVMRYDHISAGTVEENKKYIVYGVSISPWQVEDVTFIGMICQTLVETMESELIIESYDGMGYSSMIDMDGNLVVDLNRNRSMFQQKNFYSSLENGTFPNSDITLDDIKQKIQNGDSFTVNHETTDGKDRIIIFQKIEQTDWYFILVVSNEVFLEQARSMMSLSSLAIFIIVIIIAILFVLLYIMMRNTVKNKLQLEARNDFLSNMSHEIRTPLNGLIGLNHLMIQHIDDRDKTKEYLQKSSHTAQYLLALVNDILDMSKLQAGKVDLHPAPADLEMIIDNVASMQRANIEQREIQFIIDTEISNPCVICDEIRIKQVLMNLLSNAAKFTPAGGKITLRTRQKDLKDTSVITCFEVIDTGCGMSREFCEHIFEAFTQERNKNSESQKGTGLGMAISYLLMKAMGGNLSVESEVGKGSHFTACFLAELTSEEVVVEEFLSREPSEISPTDKKDLHILIAEDNELNGEILTELLSDCGIQTDLAVNGQEAVEKFAASQPGFYHVILMDIQMPVMNGYEAAKAIRNLERTDAKTVSIFACTANTFQEDIDKAMESGMDDFLGKPIDVSELLNKLTVVS